MLTAQMQGRVIALLCGLGAFSGTAGHAQSPVNKYGNPLTHAPKPTTAAITAEELRTRLYIFSDDSMQGRRVATVGNMKGTAYIAGELKRLGVEPGGDNGSYFQRLPYIHRMISDRSTLSVGGAQLSFLTDFVAAPGMHAPNPLVNVVAIYGGVEGDTTRQITPAQAAGKFVIMSPGVPGQGGGRNGQAGGANGNAPAALPAGCAVPTGGRGAGGRGAPGSGGVSAATLARFSGAAAVAMVDLDALNTAQRMAISNPLTAVAVSGRGGAPTDPAAFALAGVATPNPAYQATTGDLVVTNGNQIAIVRGNALVSGTLPAGWTAATARQKADSMSKKSADSTALAVERRDTLVATAQRLLAAGSHAGTAMFRGASVALDSTQIVTLGCAAPANRGGGGGRGARGGAGVRGSSRRSRLASQEASDRLTVRVCRAESCPNRSQSRAIKGDLVMMPKWSPR